MAIEAARLIVEIGANISNLIQGTSKANNTLSGFITKSATVGAGLTAFVTAPAIIAAKNMLNLGMAMEQSQIAFKTMLGSAEKAGAFLKDLQDFADKTPFEFTELQGAARKMLAFGFAAEKVLPMMTDIGDAVSGLGLGADGVNRVTLALGQMQAKSKVSGQEMMQLTESGIPAWKYLAEAMGKSTAEVMKMSEQGLIPAGQAIDYILGGMRQDFGGMMAKQAETAAGQLSTLSDSVKRLATDIGISLLPMAKELITKVSEGVQWFGELSEAAKQNVLTMVEIAVASGPVILGLSGLTKAITIMIPAISALGAGFSLMAGAKTLGSALSVASLGIAGITAVALPAAAAITAVTLAWGHFITKTKEQGSKDVAATWEKFFKDQVSQGKGATEILNEYIAAQKRVQDQLKYNPDAANQGKGLEETAKAMVSYQEAMTGSTEAFGQAMLETTTSYGQYFDIWMQGEVSFDLLSEAEWNAANGMKDFVLAAAAAGDGLTQLDTGLIISQSSFDAMVTSASRTKDGLQGLLGEVKNIQTEMDNWVKNTAGGVENMLGSRLPESSKLYSDALGVVDEVMGTNYLQAFNLEQTTKKLVDQYARTGDIESFREGLKKIKEEGLEGMARQLENATEKAQALYDQLMNLPANVRIKIELDDSGIPAWLKTEDLGTDMMGLAGASAIPEAVGGPVYPGLSYLVGEHGPELFNPSTPGTILPNQQSSSRTLQVTVYNSGAEAMDEDRLAQAISQWEWAYGI